MNKEKLLLRFLASLLLAFIGSDCAKKIVEPKIVEPIPQFLKIHFHYEFANELNTFEQTYTKDLVMDGTITVRFWLTEAEQQRILEKLQTVDFFHFPDTLMYRMGPDSVMVSISPDPGWQFIRVAHQNEDKMLYWRYPLPEENEFVPPLLELMNLIIGIIESKPEYKALPAPRGGRL